MKLRRGYLTLLLTVVSLLSLCCGNAVNICAHEAVPSTLYLPANPYEDLTVTGTAPPRDYQGDPVLWIPDLAYREYNQQRTLPVAPHHDEKQVLVEALAQPLDILYRKLYDELIEDYRGADYKNRLSINHWERILRMKNNVIDDIRAEIMIEGMHPLNATKYLLAHKLSPDLVAESWRKAYKASSDDFHTNLVSLYVGYYNNFHTHTYKDLLKMRPMSSYALYGVGSRTPTAKRIPLLKKAYQYAPDVPTDHAASLKVEILYTLANAYFYQTKEDDKAFETLKYLSMYNANLAEETRMRLQQEIKLNKYRLPLIKMREQKSELHTVVLLSAMPCPYELEVSEQMHFETVPSTLYPAKTPYADLTVTGTAPPPDYQGFSVLWIPEYDFELEPGIAAYQANSVPIAPNHAEKWKRYQMIARRLRYLSGKLFETLCADLEAQRFAELNELSPEQWHQMQQKFADKISREEDTALNDIQAEIMTEDMTPLNAAKYLMAHNINTEHHLQYAQQAVDENPDDYHTHLVWITAHSDIYKRIEGYRRLVKIRPNSSYALYWLGYFTDSADAIPLLKKAYQHAPDVPVNHPEFLKKNILIDLARKYYRYESDDAEAEKKAIETLRHLYKYDSKFARKIITNVQTKKKFGRHSRPHKEKNQ